MLHEHWINTHTQRIKMHELLRPLLEQIREFQHAFCTLSAGVGTPGAFECFSCDGDGGVDDGGVGFVKGGDEFVGGGVEDCVFITGVWWVDILMNDL
jgi:hypothetical protein